MATPAPLTKTKNAEVNVHKVEVEPEVTFQELCAKMISMLNNMLVTCCDIKVDSTTSMDLSGVVPTFNANTKSVPIASEVSNETSSTNWVDTSKLCMRTPAKCLTKGYE
uniref:Uncharacterized protein n=1 Tax=Leersia perrieri TaxID=77586 RepID=A0A0D9XYF7_9ORYZ